MAQRRVLIRARDLAAFRHALVTLATDGDPLAARRTVVLVPSRAAAALLREALEQRAHDRGASAVVCPDLLTREEWLARMTWVMPAASRWLSRTERLVLLGRAVDTARTVHPSIVAPFDPRPGLVSAMLDFYDELRRRQRRVRMFARTAFDELRVERGTDQGTDTLIDQTCFLGFAYLAYERAVTRSGGVDEHALRSWLLSAQPRLPFDRLVVAVADHPADLRGLWPADFDLIGRLRELADVQVVMTDEAHDAGFRARVEHELPGIEESRAPDVPRSPVLVTDADEARPDDAPPVDVRRDREEELRQVARHIRQLPAPGRTDLVAATAIVFHRPLPYLYLARQVLADAQIPYQAYDALPLAVEPAAALLDLALAVVRTEGGRQPTLELLRCPLARFEVEGHAVSADDVQALDHLLTERRSVGNADAFEAEVDAWASTPPGRRDRGLAVLRRTAAAARSIADSLSACRHAPTASAQVRCLLAFLRDAAPPAPETNDRSRRAWAAVLGALDELADACERCDDRPRAYDDLAALLYHVVEAQTFAPGRGEGGVHLVDAASARFGEFDDVFLVGLVETDWSQRPRRNVFYATSLLKALGWPQDADQRLAQQAAFRDVLTLARGRTRLSAFQLDGETMVAVSPILDEARGLPVVVHAPASTRPVFADELLTADAPHDPEDGDVGAWLAARRRRPPLSDAAYAGTVAPLAPTRYRVSQVDRYVTCPFKYFSAHVLHLDEERDAAAGLTPLERGTLLHLLFERFFDLWQQQGRGAITPATLPAAQALAATVADTLLARLPATDRDLERLHLLGSIVGPGAVDRVLELEAASSRGVARRRIEVPIEGTFVFPVRGGLSTRAIAITGKADRVDVLDDGSLRVVDYKLGRLPDVTTSVQVAVYAYCGRQLLEREDGRAHPVSDAMYLAFGDDRRFDGRLPGRTAAEVSVAVESRAGSFADMVGGIEQGAFPPRPLTTSECQWCGYAGVCRKEYRIDDDGPAESL